MSRKAKDDQSGSAQRAEAAIVVDRVLQQGESLDRPLADLDSQLADSRDVSAAKAYAFGALRFHSRHRLIIERLLDRPLRSRDAILSALLSVGLYQLCHSSQPDYAVVSATVGATKLLRRERAAGLVNATLRRFVREREEILAAVSNEEEGRFSHPAWIVERVRTDWPAHYESILAAGLEQAPMWLRVNRHRISRDEYHEELATAGLPASADPAFIDALRLEQPVGVAELPGFDAGLVSVQDAASQFAAPLLAPEPGMRVLDACAAPGGKTSHLLEIAAGDLDLLAIDIDKDRLARVDENLLRLGLRATTRVGNALQPDEWFDGGRFDRILVDAPCSASGVIRRHPDIMHLRRDADIPTFAETQLAMLTALWSKLKPGGRLLYSTCSVFRAENESVLHHFLDRHPDAGLAEISPPSGTDAVWQSLDRAGVQCLPGAARMDGIYYALMMRQA